MLLILNFVLLFFSSKQVSTYLSSSLQKDGAMETNNNIKIEAAEDQSIVKKAWFSPDFEKMHISSSTLGGTVGNNDGAAGLS